MNKTSERLAGGCIAIAIAIAIVLLVSLDSHLTFNADDWELLVVRRGWSPGTFLYPFHEHIILAQAFIYKTLLALFGMGSALPFYLVSIAIFALAAGLLFSYLRPRIGSWLAFLFVVPLLLLGAASEDLLWAFQMGFFGSMAAGMGMLIALDRGNSKGDRIACALLLLSLASSSLGIAFAVAALVDLGLGRKPRRSRAFVALLPVAAYAVWWAGWGHTAESHISLQNLENLPEYVLDAASAGIASLWGREVVDPSRPGHPPLIYQGLLLVAVIVGAVRIAREGRVTRGFAIALALGLAFWLLAGLNRDAGRYPTSSRYQYPSAVFLLLMAAEMLKGVRVPRLVFGLVATVAAGAVLGGLTLLRQQDESWRAMSDSVRLALASVEIAGAQNKPDATVPLAGLSTVTTRDYLASAKKYGSPAYDERALLAKPDADRAIADGALVRALGIALMPVQATPQRRTLSCRAVRASSTDGTKLILRPGTIVLDNTGAAPVRVLLSRFSVDTSIDLGALGSGAARSLSIPGDGARQPWRLAARGDGPIRVCTTKPAPVPKPPVPSLRRTGLRQ